MTVKKLKFITPLIDEKTYKLDKKCSCSFVLADGSEIFVASNIGPRERQEDTVSVGVNGEYILLLVADGVGGNVNGSAASYIVSKTIQRWFSSLSQKVLSTFDEFRLKLILVKVLNEMKEMGFPLEGGTTLNMSIIGPEKTFVVNAGDSRAYGIKADEVIYRTIDDSLAFDEYYPTTVFERDALRFYKNNNIITNCIEMESKTRLRVKTIKSNDYNILCHVTDGVSDILDEETIRKYVYDENPALGLVNKAINTPMVFNKTIDVVDFVNYIVPHDNASAIVYTKKKVKNN